MKKNYIQPATLIVRVNVERMISVSGPAGSTVYTDEYAETGAEGLVKHNTNSVSWDDWE